MPTGRRTAARGPAAAAERPGLGERLLGPDGDVRVEFAVERLDPIEVACTASRGESSPARSRAASSATLKARPPAERRRPAGVAGERVARARRTAGRTTARKPWTRSRSSSVGSTPAARSLPQLGDRGRLSGHWADSSAVHWPAMPIYEYRCDTATSTSRSSCRLRRRHLRRARRAGRRARRESSPRSAPSGGHPW